MVGIDPVRGAPRFTFGIPSLYDGVGFIPVVMGLFGVAEILLTIEKPYRQVITTKLTSLLPSREEWRRSLGAIAPRHRHRLFPRPHPGRRRHHPDLRRLRGREAHLQDAGEVRPGRHRGRGGARDRQQRLRQRGDDPAADARHPELAHHRRADGRLHHQWPDPGSVPVPGASRPRLGGDRQLLPRQHPAADPQPAAGRPVGASAAPALSVRLRRHAAVLHHRRLQPAAEHVRRRRHDRVRHHRLRHAQDRPADRARWCSA